jgi:hypothetical protein
LSNVNSNELNHKQQKKKKNAIKNEGVEIVGVTLFGAKPQKKGRGRHFLVAKPSKKVATSVVLFFNTNLLLSPSALQPFYATMNKKKIFLFLLLQKEEEEGDGSVVAVTFFATL